MFDSPFAYCPKCNQMVLLDQTQRECKAEHTCGNSECPLQECFTGIEFRQPVGADKKRKRTHDPG